MRPGLGGVDRATPQLPSGGSGQAAVTPGGAGRAGALEPGVMAGQPSFHIPTQISLCFGETC